MRRIVTTHRTRKAGVIAKPSFGCWSAAVWAVSIASLLGVSSASAAPLEGVAGAARSVVTQTVAVIPAPTLPSSPLPVTPAPIAAPVTSSATAIPQVPVMVPAAPQAPVKVPTVTVPVGTTTASSRLAPSTSTGVTEQAAASVRNSVDPGSGSQSSSGAKTMNPGVARSIESAKVAPSRRWLAYIGPAIDLGPFRKLLNALLVRGEGKASPLIFDATRSLLNLTGITGVPSAPTLSGHSVSPVASPADSIGVSVPGGGEISLVFIVSSAALMALFAFTVKRELDA